jgi:hypothetical protein
LQIHKIELGGFGPGQAIRSADDAQIVIDGVIARHHQMVAVIDHRAELRVKIGAAAAAALGGGLRHLHLYAGLGQSDRGR